MAKTQKKSPGRARMEKQIGPERTEALRQDTLAEQQKARQEVARPATTPTKKAAREEN
jgi:hypothetical protein